MELSLRLFDRDGLKLIPALQFVAPLPELEKRLREGDDATGIQLIGENGKPYTEVYNSKHGAGPYYNPLNEHVQEAMLNVVRELLKRYHLNAQHPSFGGLAIELTADGFAQLPGPLWGLDDNTIARFQQDTDITVPGEGPNRFAERAKFLAEPPEHQTSKQHTAWLNWRARELAEFYRRLQTELTLVRRDAVLYLAPTNLFDTFDAKTYLRPALPATSRTDEVLLMLGIRGELYRDRRGLVLLRPTRINPPGPPAPQGIDLEVNRARNSIRCCAARTRRACCCITSRRSNGWRRSMPKARSTKTNLRSGKFRNSLRPKAQIGSALSTRWRRWIPSRCSTAAGSCLWVRKIR